MSAAWRSEAELRQLQRDVARLRDDLRQLQRDLEWKEHRRRIARAFRLQMVIIVVSFAVWGAMLALIYSAAE